ncbi:MAG: hypothetical protein ACLUD0_20495 [Eubacterium ramulus]
MIRAESYHFEIVCEDEQTAAFLKEQMAAFLYMQRLFCESRNTFCI